MEETRKARIMIGLAGGTASKNSINYKLAMPTAWMQKLGITKEDRNIILSFDGKRIIIKKEEKQI